MKKFMNSPKSKAVARVGFIVGALSVFQANATNITLGPAVTPVPTSTNQFMGIGDVNTFAGSNPQFAVGVGNVFGADSFGIMVGWSNELEGDSTCNILVGLSNSSNAPSSAVFGESNSVYQDPATQWNPGNFIAGTGNEIEGYMSSAVFGTDNHLVFAGNPSYGGASSLIVGQSNQLGSLAGWVIGYSNEASGDASSTFGWGLLNPGFAATVVGAFNNEIESSSSSYEGDGAAFVVGNGVFGTRSNAIETLKNGETTLINKAWNPAAPLVVPAAADSADGRALVVSGHTLLKGQVIIAEPQGDISMGDYAE